MIAKQSLLLLLLLTISHVHCESSSSSSMPQTLQYEFSASLVAQHMHSNATRCFSDTQHNLQRALDRFQLDITPLSPEISLIGSACLASKRFERIWCNEQAVEIEQIRTILALLTSTPPAPSSSSTDNDNNSVDAFGFKSGRSRATRDDSNVVSVVSEFRGLRPLLHTTPHARLMAHSNERRVIRFDATTHDVLSVTMEHELHLPALPMHTGETMHNESASLQHTVLTGSGSLTLVDRRTAPVDQLDRFAQCQSTAPDNEALASCMLIPSHKRDTTRIVMRLLHEPLRVHVHDDATSSVEKSQQDRRRQATAMVTPSNATNPAFVSNPRTLTNCPTVDQCADKAFGFKAPREPKHRFERGIGNVNAFTVMRAVSDVKLPNISAGGDIIVFAGATVQTSFFGVTFPVSESYVSVRLPRAASQSLIDAFPPCAGIPGDVYNSFGSDVILTVDDGQNTAKWGCLDVTSRRGIKSTCQSYVATVFNETVTEYGDVSTKLFDAQGPLAVAGIPINVQLTGTGTVTFRHSIGWYTAGATGGGRMFQVSVEPLVRLSLSVNVAFPREYDEDVFALAATANGEVIDTSSKTLAASSQLAVVASLNVDTELTCGHIQIVNTGSSSRIDATVTSLTKNRRSTPIYESFASPWLASVAESDCCNLPPASCFQPSVADFQRGVCKCVDGWSGTGCDIVCPPDCNLPTDERLRKSCSAGKCECLPGSYGYECLLTCPGGGTCSGHGTCAPDGRCLCADGYFGRDCAATCVNGCGAEGRCVWSGSAAVCECTLAAAGPRCQAVCAKGGALQMPCSGRGRCFDSGTLVGVCVCEIGYGGAACDVRVVGGSGLALHFDGKVDSVAEFPLDLKTETTLMPRGVMATFWMFVDALPAAGVHATLVEFKYAWIQLSSSGTVKMCDATGGSDTVDQCARAPMTIAPRQWYHVAAGVRDEFGSFQVGVHVFKSGGAPRSESSAITDPREFNTLRGDTLRIGSLFTGSIDQVHVLALAPNFCSRTVVTDSETCRVMFSSRYSDQLYDLLSSIRLSILHPSHPLVVFSSQLDTGRGATQYADAPLAPGTIKGGVTRVSADGVPVVSASVASVVSAPFKLTLQSASEGGQPIEQSIFYSLELLGRRYKAIGVKLVFMATTLSQNGPYDECTITATLMPPVNSTDSPIVVLNNFKVAGGRLIYETSILSDYFGSNDRNEIVWKLNRACDGGSRFVTIDSSMMLLPTAVSDGVAQFGLHGQVVGLMESGQITGEPITAPLEASAWIWRDASVTQARDGVRGSIVQVYSGANELVLSLAEDWSAVDSSAGLRVVLANGVVLGKDDAPYSTRSGVWEHVALRVGTLGGNQCRLIALVNGRPVAQSSPFNCGNGLVKGTDAGYRVRLGANFRGRINDVLLRTGAVAGGDISREIYSEYAGLLSARIAFWSFDGVPDGAAQIPASARSAAATLTASGGAVVVERLAFRGTERCPGTSTCGLTLFERGGECGEVDGLARCACSTGFAGAECLECPGGAKNPCSGHGVCIGLVDGTMCACRRGYLGDACQHACPGMGRLENPNDFVCMNDGVCRIDGAQQRAAGGAGEPVTPLARCFCGAARDRYGDFCQFQQGQKPVFSLSCDTCGDDGDANKQCVDNVCGCGEGFYLAGEGGFRCVESRLREPPQVGASVGLIVGVLLLSALLIAAMACYGKRLIDRAPLRFEAIVKRERTDQSIREEEKRRLQDINTEAQW